ncbi:MAG: hypothetical protein WCJ19_05310 [bacterium]
MKNFKSLGLYVSNNKRATFFYTFAVIVSIFLIFYINYGVVIATIFWAIVAVYFALKKIENRWQKYVCAFLIILLCLLLNLAWVSFFGQKDSKISKPVTVDISMKTTTTTSPKVLGAGTGYPTYTTPTVSPSSIALTSAVSRTTSTTTTGGGSYIPSVFIPSTATATPQPNATPQPTATPQPGSTSTPAPTPTRFIYPTNTPTPSSYISPTFPIFTAVPTPTVVPNIEDFSCVEKSCSAMRSCEEAKYQHEVCGYALCVRSGCN